VAEINSAARAAMKKGHMPLRDRLISRTSLLGAVMTPVAPIARAVLRWRLARVVMEWVVGIHRDAAMPTPRGRTFTGWWRRHRRPADVPVTRGQVVFFHGCAGKYFEVETSVKAVELLEHLGFEVLVPAQGCCGLAMQSNGLFDSARASVRRLARALGGRGADGSAGQGAGANVPGDVPIVSASASCCGMLKHEAREILGVEDPELADVGGRVRELSEFLLELADAGTLPLPPHPLDMAVAYHAPCQLKGQNIGLPAVALLGLIPGLTVVESGVACCGIAGTYGLKKEKYAIGQAVGEPLFALVRDVNPELAACDTETCRWQIARSTGAEVVHPVWLLHKAYGLS
jgi:glycerol-3-phosphate dehydrogenase subunit C